MDSSAIVYSYPSQDPRHDAAIAAPAGVGTLFSGNMPSFKDLLDIVNPLQQLPVIGTVYRAITGDTISAGAEIMGGTLFGGPIGLISSAINAGLKAASGGDIGDHVLAMLEGSPTPSVQMASAKYQQTQNLS